jgi:hypothetical protein
MNQQAADLFLVYIHKIYYFNEVHKYLTRASENLTALFLKIIVLCTKQDLIHSQA